MDAGLALIVGIAVGLPLVALAVARRLPPPRLRPVRLDPFYEWSRRHRLSVSDHARIEDAVRSGRRVQPENLVPAAHEYAELVLGRTRLGPASSSRRRRVWRGLMVVYLLLLALCLWKSPGAVGGIAVGFVSLFIADGTQKRARQALVANQVEERAIGNGACATDLPPSLT